MKRVAKFEKVSFEQYAESRILFERADTREKLKVEYDKIQLPKRATKGSAGHDFVIPFDLQLYPGESVLVPSGIRVRIEEGYFLQCHVRSGLGFKYRLQLDNGVAIIDSDYYNAKNEGHIMFKITNDSKDKTKRLQLSAGDRFIQGIFTSYGITTDDEVDETRDGGLGSTGSK